MSMKREILALGLATLMALSVAIAPAAAQAAEDPKQPSPENPHMHTWGTDDLSSCWTHFDGNDSAGSAESGYGSRVFSTGSQVEVGFSCPMQENLKQNLFLNPNGTIVVELGFRIFSDDCDPDQDPNCKELTLTLSKGNLAVATEVFPAVNNDWEDDQVRWELSVDSNTSRWNMSSEEPKLTIEFSKPGRAWGPECIILDCEGEFRMYYSNNGEGMAVETNFPVINQSLVPGSGGEGGPDSEDDKGVPGFGLLTGLSALALALATGRFGTEEE